ncbi:DMRT2 [Mytilus edulis]|uniref:DMRT2 n=1 Tax=Mytilus edulis TaxID=6550 RepID=A0A8S3TFZ9_MYTED|nr:DMRT2 [Mytilus edulis]
MPPDTKQRQRECQKCLAHGVHVRFKGHKLGCFFRDCQCQRCQVVSIKRQKNKIVTAQKRRLEMENVKKIETEQANRKESGEISDCQSSVCSHCGFYPPTVTPYPRPYPPSLNWLLNQQNSTSCGGGNTSSNNYSSNLGYKPQVNYVQPATPSMPYNSTPGYMQGPHHDIPHSTVLYGTPASQQDGNLIL